ncbi:GTP-binding protein HflX [Kandleria vitulina DSM 20405]|jgi:GTP-binding protein HflX|uniref:GTPase HflX n=1 Tax=Kandleria vitulina DSM 20405 TaxID=1410657 RepID=A0A0R2HLV0_9FIRM|nr:GTPase HflX [Kandleria vitulina]KRN50269.1 GTP-binding protein HflX [Kandleria vitulina DSM 20405]MEE0987788.1 GTPase HflX [Kandleria vitulina]HAD22791.1 GTPase HflX [Kandleria vitulina]HAH74842.1 GTPase HflX [Kandleria vitulina]HBG67542.1 GTPase HflX [Kandleria vitulina]
MKAILVALKYTTDYDFDISIKELKELCRACQIEVTHIVTQAADPNKTTYVGIGKIKEIRHLIEDEDMVIFNEELTPLQLRNISDLLGIEVKDRTDLILRIFESRARTKEAKLQVEVARLKYELPRLAGAHEEMYSQQGGSGFRGSGEQQIEIERRHIRRHMAQVYKELREVTKERQTQRKRRENMKVVALVGYTNAGKSTLLNLFTQKKVYSEDMLFATLETSTRQAVLKNNRTILMSDTVGFISQLPHHLIEAFKSTLEEVKEADLILHVVDASSPYANKQIEVTNMVLKELGVETPMLYVYNKCDLEQAEFIVPRDPYVFISAKNNLHIDKLEDEIIKIIYKDEERITLYIPYEEGDLYKKLIRETTLIKEEFQDECIAITIEAPTYYANKYSRYRKV